MQAENVYIYECSNHKCTGFMTMHEQSCATCLQANLYFDEHAQVKKEVQEEVTAFLADYVINSIATHESPSSAE